MNPKLKLAHTKGETSLPLFETTIGDLFDLQVSKHRDNVAVVAVHQKIQWSWETLKEKVDSFATGLVEKLGLKKGDRVGVWLPNCVEWLVVQYAASKIGVIMVTLNPAYRLIELKHSIKLTGCKVLIIIPTLKGSNYVEMINQICPQIKDKNSKETPLPSLEYVINIGNQKIDGLVHFEELYSKPQPDLLQKIGKTLFPHEGIHLVFTSGTTGLPKAATLTHYNVLNNAYMSGYYMNLSSKDILCTPVPIFHCFGLILSNYVCLVHGCCLVYPNDTFCPEATLRAVDQERCTALHGVPTMFIAELNLPNRDKYDLSSLRTGIMAGATCPIVLMKRVINEMNLKEITIAYGVSF